MAFSKVFATCKPKTVPFCAILLCFRHDKMEKSGTEHFLFSVKKICHLCVRNLKLFLFNDYVTCSKAFEDAIM